MSDPLSPRTLVATALYRTRSCDTVERVVYDVKQASGLIDDGPGYKSRIVGFAAFPPHTRISRHTDADAFVSDLQDKAVYLEWVDKPEGKHDE